MRRCSRARRFIKLLYLLYILGDIHSQITDVKSDEKMKKILVSLPKGVFDLIRDLKEKGEMGESYSEVIRNIVFAYLSEQGYFSRMGIIRGIPAQKK